MFDEPQPQPKKRDTISSLRAECAALQAALDEALEPSIKEFHFGADGFNATLTGQLVERMALAFVSQFKAGGATNFYEMNIYDRDEPFQRYTVTVQKVGALTPADKLRAAEKRIAELEAAGVLAVA